VLQYLLLTTNTFQMKNSRYFISNLRLEQSFKAYLPKVIHRATAAVAVQYLLLTRNSGDSRSCGAVSAVDKNYNNIAAFRLWQLRVNHHRT
jgi:hypothetical protein